MITKQVAASSAALPLTPAELAILRMGVHHGSPGHSSGFTSRPRLAWKATHRCHGPRCARNTTPLCHETQALARKSLPDPSLWCEECRERRLCFHCKKPITGEEADAWVTSGLPASVLPCAKHMALARETIRARVGSS